ncbi:MAG: hypothetical protein IJW43_03505 [Clostridia bacterium]|nr:hypothetical protein [Clostridia bacterium]
MKKFLMLLLTFVLGASSIVSYSSVNGKADSYDAGDEYFLEFISSDLGNNEIDFFHNPLYDADLEINGREYIFTVNGERGYALMVEFSGQDKIFYEIEELFFNRTSPFASCVGLPVYITHNTYLEYKDQTFYDVVSGDEVNNETIAEYVYNGFNYFGNSTATFTDSSVFVNYSTKTTTEYSIQYDLPNIDSSVEGGSCAHTAGAIILTYYDRFCVNIIPNFTPYISFGTNFIYRPNATEISNMMLELVDLMLIGEPHEGTTFSEFQLGMETYVERQGYTYATLNLMMNGAFNFDIYKTSVENNKPCALFLTNFSMLNEINEDVQGQDEISSGYCPGSHVIACCGYKIDTYYDANNNVIDTRNYIKVASGLSSYGIGYLNINGVTTISKAIAIQVS